MKSHFPPDSLCRCARGGRDLPSPDRDAGAASSLVWGHKDTGHLRVRTPVLEAQQGRVFLGGAVGVILRTPAAGWCMEVK